MSDLCSTPHPDRPAVLCDKPAPCFVYHANAPSKMTWEGNPLPPSRVPSRGTGSAKGRLAQIAQRAR